MSEKTLEKIFGYILVAVGLFMLFKSMRISNFGFWRVWGISTSGIIIVLMIVSGVAVVVKTNKITKGCLIGTLCMLIISVILGTSIHFTYMSVLDLLLILAPLVIGTGLLIRVYLFMKD